MLPIVTISLNDTEYQRLREKALQLGYATITEFIIDIIEKYLESDLSKSIGTETPSSIIDMNEMKKELNSLLRKLQDLINPYTSKIDELSRKTSELSEKLETIESLVKNIQSGEKALEKREKKVEYKKTALDYLRVDGYVLQKDLKWLRKPDAFFAKLKREGAIVIEGDNGFIAIDRNFYQELTKELESIKTPDPKETIQKISSKARKLLQVLLDEGLLIYDSNSKSWKLTF